MKNIYYYKKLIGLTLICLFSFLTVSAQQNNKDVIPKGKFQEAYTPSKKYTIEKDIYKADAAHLASEWKCEGFSLTDIKGKPAVTTGSYTSNAQYLAVSKGIQLPEAEKGKKIIFHIDEKFKTESGYDFMNIAISVDEGNTWTLIRRGSGKTDWRTYYIDLTSFSGKKAIFSISLTSDSDIQSEGWSINQIQIYTASVTSKKQNTKGPVEAAKVSSIDIINVHTEDYPEVIFVDFIPRDINGDFVDGLSISDLEAWDNGRLTSSCRELYKASNTMKPAVDFLFLMDNSGSMKDDQANVARNLEAMVDKLNIAGYDIRLGLLRFGQDANGGAPQVEANPTYPSTAFFHNTDDFINFWNLINIDDGYYEPSYWAMVEGATNPLVNFRDFAQKIFVIITDESIIDCNYSPNTSRYSMQNAIDALNAKGIRLFAITDDCYSFFSDFEPVCNATNGIMYPLIQSDFSSVFDNLISNITNKYTMRYCPDAPAAPGICIPLKVGINSSPAINDETCYFPTPLPRLVRTPGTQALDGVTQDENRTLALGVTVIGGDNVQSVTLYYRCNDGITPIQNIPYIQTTTTRTPGTATFYGIIPDIAVQRYSIEYYFVAHFPNGSELVSPTENQEYFAWTIPIKPNYAPYIRNINAPTQSNPCQDVTITATISDDTDFLTKTILFYKTNQAPSVFIPISMTHVSGNSYTATIPKMAMQTTGVSYYIYAEDNYGTQGWYGTPENPKNIKAVKATLSTSRPMMLGVYNTSSIMLGCSPMGGTDVVKAYFTNECGQLQEAGSGGYNPLYPFIQFNIYGNSGSGYKDGFDMDEIIYFRLVRDGKEYDMGASTSSGSSIVRYNGGFELFNALGGTGIPNISLEGGNPIKKIISPNDITPSVDDGTDFETTISEKTHTYTITNTGCADLLINGIFSSNPTQFEVSGGGSTTIPIGGQYDFQVTYKALSTSQTTISIINNSDLNTLNFDVKGTLSAGGPVNCDISIYPNPMTSANYGGFVAFDVTTPSVTSVMVYEASNGMLRQIPLSPTNLSAGRHNYYISKAGLTPGVYVVIVNIGNNNCSGTLIIN